MKTIKLINKKERRNKMKIENTKPLMIEVDENNIVKPNKTNINLFINHKYIKTYNDYNFY